MKKTLLVAGLLLTLAGATHAATLSPQQALERFNSSTLKPQTLSRSQGPMALQSTVGNLYIFSSGEGYVVLPNDDRAPALLAFSDNGSITTGKPNPGVEYWLDYYNRELDYLHSIADPTATATSTEWRSGRSEIEPLLTTEWNQERPYNLLCPEVDGHPTVTGCVATAMAQVLKYHNYPEQGFGEHSYRWRGDTLSFDYGATTFKWDLMLDRYDNDSPEDSKEAVAELMLACGISVDMYYEPGGSGASTQVMGESLMKYFGYSKGIWLPSRDFYGIDEWEDMIYADLAKGLPVLYSGYGTGGGHQFVCDGYRSDGYFHFNWGWGGMSNGYFLLTALNPGQLGIGGGAGGFNNGQNACLGVTPSTGDEEPVYLVVNTSAFTTKQTAVKEGEVFTCEGNYFNYSMDNLPEHTTLGVKFESKETGKVEYVEGPGMAGYHLLDGRGAFEVKMPDLPDGTYTITPAVKIDGKWLPVRMPVGKSSFITAEVKDKEATFGSEASASIEITDLLLPSPIFIGKEMPIDFTAVNTTASEYYGKAYPYLLNAAGKEIGTAPYIDLDVTANSSHIYSDYVVTFTAVTDEELTAGNYFFVFRDGDGENISTPVAVKVEGAPAKTVITISDFRLKGSADPVDNDAAIRFDYTIHCEEGYFYSSPRIHILDKDGREVDSGLSTAIYIPVGKSAQTYIVMDMSGFDDGLYRAVMYYDGEKLTEEIPFRIGAPVTGIETIENDLATKVIYDLNGIRRQPPLAPGVYIINGHKTLIH